MTTSHAGHNHPATKSARRACRKGSPVRRFTLTSAPFVQLVNNGTVKHRVMALALGHRYPVGPTTYATSPVNYAWMEAPSAT